MKMNDLNFDPCQFARHHQYAASAETKIDFTDYGRMHTEWHLPKNAAWVPPFAMNNRQLQKVLLLRAWRYVHGGQPLPENVDRVKLNQTATARALKGHKIRKSASTLQHETQATHQAAVQRAGGYMQLQAAIAFRAWRLGQDSVAVADSLGLTPICVRQVIQRLRRIAKGLGFDVGKPGHTAGKKVHTKKFSAVRAVRLFKAGYSISETAQRLGYPRGHGQNRTRAALVAAGVYKMKKAGL